MLLRETEHAAERALHVARGVFLLTILLVFLLQTGQSTALLLAAAAAFPLIGLLWVLAWRLLCRADPPAALPYILIVCDAWLVMRGPLFAHTRVYAALGVGSYLTPADLFAMAAPWLAIVAITGAVRLVPRLAMFSTTVALLAYAVVAIAVPVSRNLALFCGATIAFAGLLGIQIARVFRYTALKAREEGILERYVPESLIDELARSGDPIGAGREADITVLIVDIRDYSRRVERLSPREAVAFLNDYFSVVVAPLAAEGAILDKYIGDGVFSFFEGTDQQRRALRAARAILAAVERYNVSRPTMSAVSVGIAIHSGRALVGTIGAEQKREYTAIADAVNLAARLEELNKTLSSSVVVSDVVLGAVTPAERAGFVGPTLVPIRGHEGAVQVHYLPVANAPKSPPVDCR